MRVWQLNKSNNQRYKDTERAFLDAAIAIISSRQKLSVEAVCRSAGFNRSAFYLHFADIPALIEGLELRLSRELMGAFTREGTCGIVEGFENLFAFIAEHACFYREWFTLPCHVNPFPFIMPPEHMEQLLALRRELGLIQDSEFNYQQLFFMGGMAEVTRAWLNCGCAQTPREITRILLGLFSHTDGPWVWN